MGRRDFAFRDYYRGVKELAPSGEGIFEVEGAPYISRAYRGEASCGPEFSVTAPIVDEKKRPIGFILASVHAQHTFERIGIAHLDGYDGTPLQSAIFAERSNDRPGHTPCLRSEVALGRFIAVVHPNLIRTQEYPLDPALSDKLHALTYRGKATPQFDPWERDPLVMPRFIDPVTQVEQMGAFAPVGRTSLAVAVFAERSHFRSWASPLRSHWPWLAFGDLFVFAAGLWATGVASRKRPPGHN